MRCPKENTHYKIVTEQLRCGDVHKTTCSLDKTANMLSACPCEQSLVVFKSSLGPRLPV